MVDMVGFHPVVGGGGEELPPTGSPESAERLAAGGVNALQAQKNVLHGVQRHHIQPIRWSIIGILMCAP